MGPQISPFNAYAMEWRYKVAVKVVNIFENDTMANKALNLFLWDDEQYIDLIHRR